MSFSLEKMDEFLCKMKNMKDELVAMKIENILSAKQMAEREEWKSQNFPNSVIITDSNIECIEDYSCFFTNNLDVYFGEITKDADVIEKCFSYATHQENITTLKKIIATPNYAVYAEPVESSFNLKYIYITNDMHKFTLIIHKYEDFENCYPFCYPISRNKIYLTSEEVMCIYNPKKDYYELDHNYPITEDLRNEEWCSCYR